jgi:hypothetical protein
MKKPEIDWRQKAEDFLKAKNFGAKGYCHLKFRDPDSKSDRYTAFGIVYPAFVTRIWLLNEKGRKTMKTEDFASIGGMLAAGWDVD